MSICICWGKCLFMSSAHFLNLSVWVFLNYFIVVQIQLSAYFFDVEFYKSSISWILTSSDMLFANIFSHVVVVLSFCSWLPLLCKSFYILICLILLLLPCLGYIFKKYYYDCCQRTYCLCLLGVLWFQVLHLSI